jgi:hypothetical protein
VRTALRKVFATGAADKALKELEMAAVEGRVAGVVEVWAREHSVASEEVEAIAHMGDMARTVEAWEHCDIAEA